MDHNHLLPAGTKRQPSLIVIIGITGVVAPIEIPAGHIGRGRVYINAGKQQTAILAVLASDTWREIWNRSLIPPSDPSLPLNRGFPDPRRKKMWRRQCKRVIIQQLLRATTMKDC
jgi:hypothetical protein